ncbi:hypothetical protein CEXT_223301, partial [Caerostris extrusa]
MHHSHNKCFFRAFLSGGDQQIYPDIEYSAEKRLVDKLMRGYDNSVRPVKNASHAIVIRLGITLTQIFDL